MTLRAKLATTQPAGIEVSDQETRKGFPGIFSAKQGAKLRHPWDGANSNVQLYIPLQKTEGVSPDRVFLGHHLANTLPECGRICRVLTTKSSSQSEVVTPKDDRSILSQGYWALLFDFHKAVRHHTQTVARIRQRDPRYT